MQRPGAGLRVWSLMVAVAIVAMTFAAARVESAPGAAVAIVGACISYLSCKRYSEAVAQRQAQRVMISRLQKALLLLASAFIATAVIGLSDLAFLAGYYSYLKVAYESDRRSHFTPDSDPGYIITGVVIGVTLALCVASSLRRMFWTRDAARTPRWWLMLWPVALTLSIGTLLVAEEMRKRYSFCQMMANYHAGPEARADGPKKAALHTWLNRWYEQAAIRPWLPVHPDHVPPGLE